MDKIHYIYVLDYVTPSIVKIKVSGDLSDNKIKKVLEYYGFKHNNISFMVTNENLDLTEEPGTFILDFK